MAESKKGDSSVNLKEKKSLLDLDFGNDFLSSWKSMSMAEGDDMDFDLTPVSKGNKKSFQFDKAVMDFNLDDDFGKLSSFKMDMPDLDISSPLKKDVKSKESKESSSGKEKPKNDRFAFAFDFDELDNFNFGLSIPEEGSKAQGDKKNKECSPNEDACQDKEDSMHVNLIGTVSSSVGPQKPSLPKNTITFDIDSLVGRSEDLEPTTKNCPSNVARDDAVTSEHLAATDEVASDKAKIVPEETITPIELEQTSQSEKLVSSDTVELEADTVQDLSSDPFSNNETGGVKSSETQIKVNSLNTDPTGLNGKQDANMISIADSTNNNEHMLSENPKHLQTSAISEKNSGEDHVIDNRERTELNQVNSLVEYSRTATAVSVVFCDTQHGRENKDHTSETPKFPVVSQPADQLEKETENRRERVTCSRFFVQPKKPECPVQKASTQTTLSSLSNKKMGTNQLSLVEGREQGNVQSNRKLVSFPMQDPKTLLTMEPTHIQTQESCKTLKISREVSDADCLQNEQKLNDPTTEKKEMLKTKSALGQTEVSIKDPDTLSSSTEVATKAERNSGNGKDLAPIPTIKSIPLKEHKLPSIERGSKTPDLPRPKLSGFNLDSAKFPVQKDVKSVGNDIQNRVVSGNIQSGIILTRDSQKNLPIKRKTLEQDNGADIIAVHPFKRVSPSPTAIRNVVEASEKVLDKKVLSYNIMETDRIKSANGKCQVPTLHIPHEVKVKNVKMPFLIQSDNIIKQAEAYSKELDHLCNMLRKKHDDAKDILVQAIVNSNKLLMLNTPLLDEKVRATRNLLARLTL